MDKVVLYTDGACSGNPGPGGWAYILDHPDSGTRRKRSGGSGRTTNNRLEMQAVIHGLLAVKRHCSVTVMSDSSDDLGAVFCDQLPWLSYGGGGGNFLRVHLEQVFRF